LAQIGEIKKKVEIMKNLHTSKKEEESVLVFFIYYVIVDDKDNEIFRGNLISDENAYKINKSAKIYTKVID
jgi:hypothetical protein